MGNLRYTLFCIMLLLVFIFLVDLDTHMRFICIIPIVLLSINLSQKNFGNFVNQTLIVFQYRLQFQ